MDFLTGIESWKQTKSHSVQMYFLCKMEVNSFVVQMYGSHLSLIPALFSKRAYPR